MRRRGGSDVTSGREQVFSCLAGGGEDFLSCTLMRRAANASVIAVSDGCNGCIMEKK